MRLTNVMGVGRVATAIEVDEETRLELERRAGSLTLPYRVVVRAKLVLLAADGCTNCEIAQRVDMSADRVADWRNGSPPRVSTACRIERGRVARVVFPPHEVAQLKAVACELPKQLGLPLSRFSRSEIHRFVIERAPVHASWLNQVEIYHWIIQRKLLAPNDFASTAELARALNDFEHHYNEIAKPFDWTFTRDDLADLLTRLQEHQRDPPVTLAA